MTFNPPLIPRYYQAQSVEAPINYFINGGMGNPMIVLPTGAGKSIVIAELNRRILSWPNQRVINLTHVKELIEQNAAKLNQQWPNAPMGIYSAGLKRRDLHDDIIFAGIQSVYKKSFDFGAFDIITIDECHLISPNSNTMYQRFIKDQLSMNPSLKIIGLTATPFRTATGDITSGENSILDEIVYEKPMLELINEGYLAPLVSKRTATIIDLEGVAKRGGDFVPKALNEATNKPTITQAAVKEIIEYGHNRRSWLLFCAGIAHAEAVLAELERYLIPAAIVTGKTKPAEREKVLNDYKSGAIRAVVNCDVLTTGFDAPETDLIALLRGTHSAGLYVQMCGRGTRPVYAPNMPIDTDDERLAAIAASTKQNCLVLDFAGNVMRHGPVDQVRPWVPRASEKTEAPSKVCPQCETITHASARECKECGYKFPIEITESHDATSGDDAIMSNETVIREVEVSTVSFMLWKGKKEVPTLRVSYLEKDKLNSRFNEWIPIFHENKHSRGAVNKSQAWWRKFVGEPFPEFQPFHDYQVRYGMIKNILDDHYEPPKAIVVNVSGKYPQITNYIGVNNE